MDDHSASAVVGTTQESDAGRTRLLLDLNRDLAGLLDLAAGYKHAHWNIVGPSFAALHALFDKLAAEASAHADEVAERAVALDGMADGALQSIADRSVLPQIPQGVRSESELLLALVARAKKMVEELHVAIEQSAADPATQEVHLAALRTVEKHRWMLDAHLREG